MESQVEQSQQWLQTLLSLMGITATVTKEGFAKIESDRDSDWLNIEPANLTPQQQEQLIGDKGENLDAIQYLANTLVNLKLDSAAQKSLTIELDGYRTRRYDELLSLSESTAEQVRQTGKEIEIPNLSSAERKQIHTLLQDAEDLATESRGQEPNRRLVVRLQQ
ncbi:R3H domain-containing nucleic acid-binding protein [Myxosarcina sp. GI1]|uniref:Jag family protein n=1 Tax=Myxosarcina sp. GI1 TaxID=1541065 RepID=UPI00055D9FCC|nr:R3H domain-containing nucleic acid-binding protein [Myxosarcina sp. GI1]